MGALQLSWEIANRSIAPWRLFAPVRMLLAQLVGFLALAGFGELHEVALEIFGRFVPHAGAPGLGLGLALDGAGLAATLVDGGGPGRSASGQQEGGASDGADQLHGENLCEGWSPRTPGMDVRWVKPSVVV